MGGFLLFILAEESETTVSASCLKLDLIAPQQQKAGVADRK